MVRNGRHTLFWHDIWLGDSSLINKALAPIPSEELNKPVAFYWDRNSGWDWSRLENVLLDESLNKLFAVVILDSPQDNDIIGWNDELTGTFSMSSAYAASADHEDLIQASKWNNIWKLKLPSRIKTFLWLVRHKRILTNSSKLKRGLADSGDCWNCSNVPEDTEHVLRNYTVAREVWRALCPNTPPEFNPLTI